jgi:hypothetical protein
MNFNKIGLVTGLVVSGLSISSVFNPAKAAQFALQWSGAAPGNSASANGLIDFDPSLISNPGYTNPLPVNSFSITVTGASSGNGTFSLADYNNFFLATSGGTLDLTKQLVGQPTSNGLWGTPSFGNGGDFNIISNLSNLDAPTSASEFQIATSGGFGDLLQLTSFAPLAPLATVPEPSSLLGLLAPGTLGTGATLMRKLKTSKFTEKE